VWTGEGVTSQEGGSWVLKPGGSLIVEYPQPTQALVLLGPTEGLGTIFKLAFWVSLVATSPLWLFLLLRFIAPGLQQTEKAFVLPFLGLSLLALFGGILFAWIFTLPIANSVLRQINAGIGTDLWSLGHYLDYSVILLLGNALAFEGAVLVFFLVHQGYLTPDGMRRCRRHVIVGTLFMSAVLTPPDVFTQLLLTIPLLCLYELSILYAVWRQRCSLALLSEPAL
jgi:sec-independent protein translocase protein TatC